MVTHPVCGSLRGADLRPGYRKWTDAPIVTILGGERFKTLRSTVFGLSTTLSRCRTSTDKKMVIAGAGVVGAWSVLPAACICAAWLLCRLRHAARAGGCPGRRQNGP